MADKTFEMQIRSLIDQAEIHTCLMNYSRAVDRFDRELLLSLYHEDAIDDHGVFVGGREAFADWVFDMHRKTHLSHQHCQFNSTCEISGHVAHAETYYMFVGMNRAGSPMSMSGGRYIDRLERRSDRWAIAVRVCVRDWAPVEETMASLDQAALTTVNLDEQARRLIRSGYKSARDKSDPSYLRPLTLLASRC